MFTVNMYCSRMNAMSVRIGMVVDCTALDMEEFAPLPPTAVSSTTSSSRTVVGAAAASNMGFSGVKKGIQMDRRVRYFHNPAEWDDYDVDYRRLMPPQPTTTTTPSQPPLETKSTVDADESLAAPQSLPEFYRIVSDFLHKVRSGEMNNSSSGTASTTTTSYIALFDARGGLGAASYLAACYMCHKLKAPVHAALEAVTMGSPPQPSNDGSTKKFGLCDVKLMHDLQQRFKGQKEIVMEGTTSYPTWWWHDDNGMEHGGTDKRDNDESDVATKSGSFNDDDRGIESRKRQRVGATITIPPYVSTEVDQSINSNKIFGQNDATSSSASTLYPLLPPDILEPISKDSPKYHRAMSVLAQLTPPPPHNCDAMSYLPLKGEFDMSNESATNNNTEDNMLQCIKTNMNEYNATWLATRGRRGLLLILSEAVYFIEQVKELVPSTTPSSSSSPSTSLANHISISRVTNIKFPTSNDLTIHQHRTLLDVMLVKDVEKQPPNNNNKVTYRFYALDVLCIEGGRVWHKPLELRCRYLNEGILLPRKKDEALHHQQQQHTNSMTTSSSAHNYSNETIKIRANEYFPMAKLGYVIKEVCKGVGHEAEGVRIVPVGEYYTKTSNSSSSIRSGEWDKDMTLVWRWGHNEAALQKLIMLTRDAVT